MMNTTLEQLRSLKLTGMASALQEQLAQANLSALSFALAQRQASGPFAHGRQSEIPTGVH